jgi:TatD DNase family protein
MRLVDSHCHLQADRFAKDVDRVLARAQAAGVERILVPGWHVESSAAALELVARQPWLDASVGVHPHDAARVDESGWREIEAMAGDPWVVAIGETGLDFDRAFSPPDAQLANLRRNLELALATGKPAILHCRSAAGLRDAQDTLLAELRRAGFGSQRAFATFEDRPEAIVHSFSGPSDYAQAMLELGAAISFSGLVFRHGEEQSADVARLARVDRLLVETDSPYLAPPGAPRSRNEPEWVRVTAAWLAYQRGQDADALGDALIAGYETAFGLT